MRPVGYTGIYIPGKAAVIHTHELRHGMGLFQSGSRGRRCALNQIKSCVISDDSAVGGVQVVHGSLFRRVCQSSNRRRRRGDIVFSLSKALLCSLRSLGGTAGTTLRSRGVPAYALSRIHECMKGKIHVLVIHTIPSKRGGPGFRRAFTRFGGCCKRRYLSRAGPCPSVVRLLARLGTHKIGATVMSGGLSSTMGRLSRHFFQNCVAATVNRVRNITGGPTPSVMRGTVGVLGASAGGTVCMKSSRISVRATRGAKLPYISIV